MGKAPSITIPRIVHQSIDNFLKDPFTPSTPFPFPEAELFPFFPTLLLSSTRYFCSSRKNCLWSSIFRRFKSVNIYFNQQFSSKIKQRWLNNIVALTLLLMLVEAILKSLLIDQFLDLSLWVNMFRNIIFTQYSHDLLCLLSHMTSAKKLQWDVTEWGHLFNVSRSNVKSDL